MHPRQAYRPTWPAGSRAGRKGRDPATGVVELVAPYTWNTSGTGNRTPVSSAYRLMTVDGLALAAAHTGDPLYLTVAGRLFEGTMRQTFYWSDATYTWPAFTYSTINEAGKLAEIGGYYLALVAAGGPGGTPTPSPTPAPTPTAAPTPARTPAPTATATPTARPSGAPMPTAVPIRLRGSVVATATGDPATAVGVAVTLSGSASGSRARSRAHRWQGRRCGLTAGAVSARPW